MSLTNYFNFSRFVQLLVLELRRSTKAVVITLVIIFDLLLAGFILDNILNNYKVYNVHEGSYAFFLLLGGFIVSSLAFNDLGNPLRRHNYLTLPASTLEKFLSMWVLTCIVWMVVFTFLFILYSILANTIGYIFFKNTTYAAFAPLSVIPVNTMKYYFVLQGIFLVGAANFRAYSFAKTILTILITAVISGLIFYIILADLNQPYLECSLEKCNPVQVHSFFIVWQVLKWLFWWALAPLCWVFAYIGLKDQEV
jgi:hypothetical protein